MLGLAPAVQPGCAPSSGILAPDPSPGAEEVPGRAGAWPRVVLNELLAVNRDGATDPGGRAVDWVELLHRGGEAVDLAGWTLSDDPDRPDLHVLDAVLLEPGERLLLWADDRPELGPDHLAFGLDGAGDFVGLYAPDGTPVDLLGFGPQAADVATARLPDGEGEWTLTTRPTPGAPNEEGP